MKLVKDNDGDISIKCCNVKYAMEKMCWSCDTHFSEEMIRKRNFINMMVHPLNNYETPTTKNNPARRIQWDVRR